MSLLPESSTPILSFSQVLHLCQAQQLLHLIGSQAFMQLRTVGIFEKVFPAIHSFSLIYSRCLFQVSILMTDSWANSGIISD